MSSRKRSCKRTFQPSIDNYLSCLESDHPDASTQSSISSPSLPTFLQLSLLNVGMRVRKAVPEGYKTKFSYDIASTETCCRQSPRNTAHRYGFQELVPYSGILNIGAHQAQNVPDGAHISSLHFDDAGSFPSNQESNFIDAIPIPASTPLCANNKRRRPEKAQGDEYPDFKPLSPRSEYPVSHTKMPNLNTLRVIANSKTRKTTQHQIHRISQEENNNMTNRR